MPPRIRFSSLWISCRNTKLIKPWIQHRRAGTRAKRTTHYWTPDKLRTDPKYPLSAELCEKTAPSVDKKYGIRKTVQYLRPQIVSSDLCDDVLSYIGPSLENYKGCDILDINPGAGLWSSKLHDFLKPRNHVLLEMSPNQYGPFLNPLVEKPGSTYKLMTGDPCRWETFDELITGGYFPDQKLVASEDSHTPELNETLLVTGTIMWDPKLPGISFDSMGRQMLFQYSTMAWNNQLFHAFGRARMLLWTTNDDFKKILPRSSMHSGKTSFYMQKTADVKEIVGPAHTDRSVQVKVGREPRYELESIGLALKRGNEKGMELPSRRRENVHDFADDFMKMLNSVGKVDSTEIVQYLKKQELSGKSTIGILPTNVLSTWHEEVELGIDPTKHKRTDSRLIKSNPELGKRIKSYRLRRANLKQFDKLRVERDEAVDLAEEIYNLECRILGLDDGQEKDAQLQRLEQMQKDFDSRLERTDKNYRTNILTDVDDRLSLSSPVPRLMWDARPFEPLVMHPEEVWPPTRVSLSDITPRPLPSDQSAETFDYVRDFTHGLFFNMTDPVPKALENMQPGAAELVDQVPALRDPKKGGRLNLNNMRVRMLTVEMVDGLTQAFRDWPFRTPDADHSKYFQLRVGGSRNITEI